MNTLKSIIRTLQTTRSLSTNSVFVNRSGSLGNMVLFFAFSVILSLSLCAFLRTPQTSVISALPWPNLVIFGCYSNLLHHALSSHCSCLIYRFLMFFFFCVSTLGSGLVVSSRTVPCSSCKQWMLGMSLSSPRYFAKWFLIWHPDQGSLTQLSKCRNLVIITQV